MNTRMTLSALAAIALTTSAGSAVAGPDWTNIDRARAEKQALQTAAAKTTGQPATTPTLTLQRHGPRPQYILLRSTPANFKTADATTAK